MAETYAEAVYLQQVARERYPHLSDDAAYLALHGEILGPLLNGTLAVADVMAIFSGSKEAMGLVAGLRLGKYSVEQLTQYMEGLRARSQGGLHGFAAEPSRAVVVAQQGTELAATDTGSINHQVDGPSVAKVGGDLPSDNLHGVPAGTSGARGSPLDSINYLECWNTTLRTIQVAQGYQVIKALNVIGDHLGDSNSIAVSGAGGPDGFARPVYDFITKKINAINQKERRNHRFFVYHDSTNWHPAFARLTRETPLAPEFVNQPSDNLDHVCLFMREVRQQLIAMDADRGTAITFHLLIPSWTNIRIKEPLHFPDDLYPLQVEGVTNGGKGQVELNLPAAPAGLLHGVENVLDPNNWNKIAGGTSLGITLPTVGWGVNGACLGLGLWVGAATGIGLLAAVPIWWGVGSWSMMNTAPALENAIYDALCEEPPRILGSNNRLESRRRVG
ncbi:hypothetical protein BJX64DRAFT_299615 [Aspergillus heterothallicus]